MNFTEFSFWWILLLLAVPLFTIRFLAKKMGFWFPRGDSYLLAILSLTLFWNAARYSFIIFVTEITLNYLAVSAILKLPKKQARLLSIIIIALDLLVLIYYKYINFFL
ncbi:MAG: MBOAT family protein, partial [Cyanobacteria bacterium P01_E01_bin.42]